MLTGVSKFLYKSNVIYYLIKSKNLHFQVKFLFKYSLTRTLVSKTFVLKQIF